MEQICEICGQKCQNFKGLRQHLSKAHKVQSLSEELDERRKALFGEHKKGEIVKCPECGKDVNWNTIGAHRRYVHGHDPNKELQRLPYVGKETEDLLKRVGLDTIDKIAKKTHEELGELTNGVLDGKLGKRLLECAKYFVRQEKLGEARDRKKAKAREREKEEAKMEKKEKEQVTVPPPMDGQFHCPFEGCKAAFNSELVMEKHIISYHGAEVKPKALPIPMITEKFCPNNNVIFEIEGDANGFNICPRCGEKLLDKPVFERVRVKLG